MRIVSKRALVEFARRHPPAQEPVMAWHDFVRRREWRTPADIRNDFRSADFVAGNRVVFNIGGNRYRLIAEINFGSGWIFVRFVGTHAEYDKVDAATVSDY